MRTKQIVGISVLLIILLGILALPAMASKEKDDTGSAWNIYFRPGVRFGTESRTLYIMDFLIPLYQDEKNIIFTNTKYTPSDRGGWELNRGLGYRRLISGDKLDLILGVNAYYDQRKTDWGTKHSQWGVGLEAMADIPLKPFDLGLTGRFNYYYPLSHTKIDGLGTAYASYVLSDSGIILNGGRVEEPMRGFDYEAGMRIPYISKYVETWVYVGGYNYQGRKVNDINGFMARLEVIPTDFIRLNYEFHHDNYSNAEHYGEISFEVPFSIGNLITGKNPFEGIGDMMTGSRELKERMVEPVRRDVDVKIIVDEDNGNIPGGGEKIEDIVFVSETGSDVTGNGTKDNPYATISYALANNARIIAGSCKTIHVMNSSTTAVVDEAAGAGLTLAISDFLLWGSGAHHPKYQNIINMPYSGHPSINDTLTLNAANPTVTGLGFDVTSAAADFNCIDIANGAGVKIINNVFNLTHTGGAEGVGIHANIATLGSATNPIFIANNTFDITSDSNGNGIFFDTACVDIFATIVRNTIDVDSGGGWVRGILFESVTNIGSAASPVLIAGNTILSDGTGSPSGAYGIQFRAIDAGDTQIFANIIGNDISVVGGTYGAGINWRSEGTGAGTGNIIGSAEKPVIISGNTISVQPSSGTAFGINLWSEYDLFATITGNDMSNTIIGVNDAYGIYLYSAGGNMGSAARPVIISGNPMTLTANTGDAYGMSLNAWEDIFATITGNDMSNTIEGNNSAYGIYLGSPTGTIGSEARPVIIAGNPMTVTGNSFEASGIYLQANNDIFTTITGNDMSNTIEGNNSAFGIYLFSLNGNIGSAARPVIISSNPMTVTANNGDAYGMYLRADEYVFGRISGNNMKITGDVSGTGVYLATINRDIGSATRPVIISGNSMNVVGNNNNAYGTYIYADVDIFANIKSNYMNITSGTNSAYGAFFDAGMMIGDVTSIATRFNDNAGTINGVTGRYMLYLDAAFSGGGNYVNWGGNGFRPVGGAWSGIYGPANQVWHNFTLPPDVLSP